MRHPGRRAGARGVATNTSRGGQHQLHRRHPRWTWRAAAVTPRICARRPWLSMDWEAHGPTSVWSHERADCEAFRATACGRLLRRSGPPGSRLAHVGLGTEGVQTFPLRFTPPLIRCTGRSCRTRPKPHRSAASGTVAIAVLTRRSCRRRNVTRRTRRCDMSDQRLSIREQLHGELRRLQKAAAVLGCIQHAAGRSDQAGGRGVSAAPEADDKKGAADRALCSTRIRRTGFTRSN